MCGIMKPLRLFGRRGSWRDVEHALVAVEVGVADADLTVLLDQLRAGDLDLARGVEILADDDQAVGNPRASSSLVVCRVAGVVSIRSPPRRC
jgi:hypothetical protein